MAEAFYLAGERTARSAVLVDIPKDILQAQTTFSWPPQMDLPGYRLTTTCRTVKRVREAARMILASEGPPSSTSAWRCHQANASAQLMELVS